MNPEKLQQKLLAAARAHPPREHVPYAFEKRIMAQLTRPRMEDVGASWARAMWRAATPCLAVMLLLAAWSFLGTESVTPNTAVVDSFEQQFEQVLLAGIDSTEGTW